MAAGRQHGERGRAHSYKYACRAPPQPRQCRTDFPATHGAWGALAERGGRVCGERGTEDAGLWGPCTERQSAGSDFPLALLVAYKGAPAGVTGTATWRDSVLCKTGDPSPASSAPSFPRPGFCCRGGRRQGLGPGCGLQVWLSQASRLSPFSAPLLPGCTLCLSAGSPVLPAQQGGLQRDPCLGWRCRGGALPLGTFLPAFASPLSSHPSLSDCLLPGRADAWADAERGPVSWKRIEVGKLARISL